MIISKNLFGLLMVTLLLGGCQTASNPEIWKASIVYDKNGKAIKRFIPVELFTGAKWDGKNVLTLNTPSNSWQSSDYRVNVVTPAKSIVHDRTVIKRDRTRSSGRVYQEFEINKNKDGLTMTYQNRRGRIGYDITASKFPIGWWKLGQTKKYDDGMAQTEVSILDLDTAGHGIEIEWKTNFSEGGHYIYRYLPERGNVGSTAQ